MSSVCLQCGSAFDISKDDLDFYTLVSPVFLGKKELIPPPTLCPRCRLQRRLAFRNQIFVYQRPSSITGKTVFSRFTPDVPFPVVENDWWYGNAWDATSLGRDFDDHYSFFEQFLTLRNVVPHRTLSLHQAENCDYCNNATGIKNCYLTFNTNAAEDCLYCENCTKAKDCIDCTYCPASELCYDCVRSERCYRLHSSSFCEDCSDSAFLTFCYSCKDCFGCINLSHRQFCVFNEQKTEEEYRTFLLSFDASSWQAREAMISRCTELWKTHPRPSSIIHNTEAAEGNHILNSKNVSGSFFIEDCEDVKNCFSLYGPVKTSQDFSFFGKDSELLYEAAQCGIGDSAVVLSFDCWGNNSNLLYCWMCEGCHDCFGCVGLQKKQFCVLNKQYSKDEYHALVPKIIEHMRQTKEFGEFFPMTLSPIPYNHSVAQRYFPQTPDTTRQQGCVWYEQNTENVKQAIESSSLPDGVPTSDDAIVVKSLKSGRPFRITTQEIKRYRQMQVPLPRWTYDERMEDRIAMLGGITLHERTCDKTKKPMLTTYLPDTEFPVWEREIYNRELRG